MNVSVTVTDEGDRRTVLAAYAALHAISVGEAAAELLEEKLDELAADPETSRVLRLLRRERLGLRGLG